MTPIILEGIPELAARAAEKTQVVGDLGQPHTQIVVSGWREPESMVRLKSAQGQRIRLKRCSWSHGIVISECSWEEMSLQGCFSREHGITIERCVIGRLDIREFQGPITLLSCVIDRLIVHQTSRLVLTDSEIASLQVSEVEESLLAVALRGNHAEVQDCGSLSDMAIEIRNGRFHEGLTVTNCENMSISAQELSLGSLTIARTRLRDCCLQNVAIHDGVGVRQVSTSGVLILESSQVDGDMVLEAPTAASLRVELIDFVGSDALTLHGPVQLHLISGTLDGRLRQSGTGADGPQATLDSAFLLNMVEVPEGRIPNTKEAKRITADLLGSDGAHALAVVRRSLVERPREQDQLYFAERCQRAAQPLDAWSSISDAFKRYVLGFGVRLKEPFMALVVGVVATAILMGLAAPPSTRGISPGDHTLAGIAKTLVVAAQLWFNVGVGLPEGLSGPGWAAVAVACTVAGLLLVTTLIGVAIRRLVR